MDHLALGEERLLQLALDPGGDLDHRRGDDGADRVLDDRKILHGCALHHHRRRRRRLGLGTGEHRHDHEGDHGGQQEHAQDGQDQPRPGTRAVIGVADPVRDPLGGIRHRLESIGNADIHGPSVRRPNHDMGSGQIPTVPGNKVAGPRSPCCPIMAPGNFQTGNVLNCRPGRRVR